VGGASCGEGVPPDEGARRIQNRLDSWVVEGAGGEGEGGRVWYLAEGEEENSQWEGEEEVGAVQNWVSSLAATGGEVGVAYVVPSSLPSKSAVECYFETKRSSR
jgi:hypothetical protein